MQKAPGGAEHLTQKVVINNSDYDNEGENCIAFPDEMQYGGGKQPPWAFTLLQPYYKDILNSLDQLPILVVMMEAFVPEFNAMAIKAKRMVAERQPLSVCQQGCFVSCNPAVNRRRQNLKVGKGKMNKQRNGILKCASR